MQAREYWRVVTADRSELLDDILAGKIWAVSDSDRPASKRQKDLADIARLLEAGGSEEQDPPYKRRNPCCPSKRCASSATIFSP